ncbi:hypothetical protein, partial [Brevundimonas sp.]|uniref:hypothetical protein n=1 Tax=Brevundimonas sp. TaxID=1871086 RepID=UPI002FC9218B
GYNVKVIMTESATNIITPQTLETLSRNNVITDMWERGHQIDVEHISSFVSRGRIPVGGVRSLRAFSPSVPVLSGDAFTAGW